MKEYKPPFPNKFKPGDTAVSKENIEFTNGEKHSVGQKIRVTENNVSYFNVCHTDYDRMNPHREVSVV